MTTTEKTDPVADLNAYTASLIAKKKLDSGVVHWASEIPPVYHLPFSTPNMNYATEGGAPWDRIVALWGEESTGKTLSAMQLVATAQALPYSAEEILLPRISYHEGRGDTEIVARLKDELEWVYANFSDGATCMWYDIEGQFDPIRAQKLGVDTDRLLMSETQVIEEICSVFSGYCAKVNLHVFDSTSSASSQVRLKDPHGKAHVGLDARQWKYSLRDAQTFFQSKNTGIPNMLVLIHQMSTNVSTGGAQAATGRYMRFISSCSVQFQRGKFLWRKDGVLMDDKTRAGVKDEDSMAGRAAPDGVEVFASIEKSRTCRPFRKGAMQFDYRTLAYDKIAELASSGLYFGLIRQSGSWFSIPDDQGELQNVGQGLKQVYARLAEDPELCERIYTRLLDYSSE